jgi:hypothetical protein
MNLPAACRTCVAAAIRYLPLSACRVIGGSNAIVLKHPMSSGMASKADTIGVPAVRDDLLRRETRTATSRPRRSGYGAATPHAQRYSLVAVARKLAHATPSVARSPCTCKACRERRRASADARQPGTTRLCGRRQNPMHQSGLAPRAAKRAAAIRGDDNTPCPAVRLGSWRVAGSSEGGVWPAADHPARDTGMQRQDSLHCVARAETAYPPGEARLSGDGNTPCPAVVSPTARPRLAGENLTGCETRRLRDRGAARQQPARARSRRCSGAHHCRASRDGNTTAGWRDGNGTTRRS